MGRILIVASDSPYPLNHATAQDTWGHIQTLKNLGFTVDLILTVKTAPRKEDLHVMENAVGRLRLIERRRSWRAAAGISPFQVQSRAELANVPLDGRYEAVLLESEHVAAILRNDSLRTRKLILRLNNDEARFFRELSKSSSSLLLKAFHRMEAARFEWLSPGIMRKCDELWFVSDYEMKQHLKSHPGDANKSFLVPPRIEVKAMRQQSLDGQNVLFIGTLAFANNLRGVEWYISNVHSYLRDVPGYSLVVAGNTRGQSSESLTEFILSSPNASLVKNPEDLEELYRAAAVFVNPVFHGAGLKIKVIDAIRAGVPVVTTSNGAEGSGLVHEKHVLVADSVQSFQASVRRLLNDKFKARDMVAAAQDFLAKEYDQERIIKRLIARN